MSLLNRFHQNNKPATVDEKSPILFLDRDGVVIKDCNYLADKNQVELLPRVCDALLVAKNAGFKLVLITNQSGIGRGFFSVNKFIETQHRLDELLSDKGVVFDLVAYCPHAPAEKCNCRKPEVGLIEEVEELIPWQQYNSFVVGDKISDIMLAANIGVRSFLVLTGQADDSTIKKAKDIGATVVDDLFDAISEIVKTR